MVFNNYTFKFNSDFVAGALSLAGVLFIKMVYGLFQYPSVRQTQKIANLPIPKIGKDDQITVWGFDLPNETHYLRGALQDSSPYVDRIEQYLRLKKVAYVKAKTNGLSECPRRKVPFVNIHGTMVDDSSRILNALQTKLQDKTEDSLTEKQRMEGSLLRALLFGRLYYVLNHCHFGTVEGQQDFKEFLKKDVPAPILPLICAMIFRSMHTSLSGAGIAQLPHQEIIDIGKSGLATIAALLSNRSYVLDTKEATVYDTDLYAFLGHFFFEPRMAEADWVLEVRKQHPVLEQYTNRMFDLLYPESKKSN